MGSNLSAQDPKDLYALCVVSPLWSHDLCCRVETFGSLSADSVIQEPLATLVSHFAASNLLTSVLQQYFIKGRVAVPAALNNDSPDVLPEESARLYGDADEKSGMSNLCNQSVSC
jgi:hypothetical protein